MIRQLVIFGASGDLTFRALLPALAQLYQAGALPDDFRTRGVARHEWDDAAFRARAQDALARVDNPVRDAVIRTLEYRRADVTEHEAVRAALDGIDGPMAAYLALPPSTFAPLIQHLPQLGMPPGSKVVVEKPFGSDLASACELNRLLHEALPERAVFRIDHFLHKQTVQNVLGLRFANRVFESLWHREHIERVEIVWDETLTVEGRAGYYEEAGALRDMVQNHLLQLLCLIGMDAPLALNERDLRNRKIDVLRAVRRLSADEVTRWTVRARYAAGAIGDRRVPAYVDEPGVDARRDVETFAQVTLFVDSWRWAGVPFVLRSGKALARDRRHIAIRFRPVPHLAFQSERPLPNVLSLEIDPDRVALDLSLNGPGDPFELEPVQLAAVFPPQDLTAYARLLLNVLEGDATLSIRDDEAEESWRIVEPILHGWAAGRVPMREYPAGSGGDAVATPTPRRGGSGPGGWR